MACLTAPIAAAAPLLQPLEFTAGERVNLYAKKADSTAGGLFAGGSGPKPPPAISTAVIGMKPGGRVSRGV